MPVADYKVIDESIELFAAFFKLAINWIMAKRPKCQIFVFQISVGAIDLKQSDLRLLGFKR